MVHYIRFLKTPLLSKSASRDYRVSSLITINTDLGESLLATDVPLSAVIVSSEAKPTSRPITISVRWRSKLRVLEIIFQVPRHQIHLPARVYVTCDSRNFEDALELSNLPGIISAWSAPFDDASQQAEWLVERRFKLHGGSPLSIWEETGDSIARHIWDSGPPMLAYLALSLFSSVDELPVLRKSRSHLVIIELGSGCGIVGIGLAQLLTSCDMLLTDLPEAQDILNRNIEAAQLRKDARISACVLDWESDLPPNVLEREHDIILISDCTYNTDTIPALVSTLSRLCSRSADAAIVLATKVRHDSEAAFFTCMEEACFAAERLRDIDLPNLSPAYEGDFEKVEIYTFHLTGHEPSPTC